MLKKDYENGIGMILRCLIMKCLLVYFSLSVGKCFLNLLFLVEF